MTNKKYVGSVKRISKKLFKCNKEKINLLEIVGKITFIVNKFIIILVYINFNVQPPTYITCQITINLNILVNNCTPVHNFVIDRLICQVPGHSPKKLMITLLFSLRNYTSKRVITIIE